MRRIVRFTVRPDASEFKASYVSEEGRRASANAPTPEDATAGLCSMLAKPENAEYRGSWRPTELDPSNLPLRWLLFVDVLGFAALQRALVHGDGSIRQQAIESTRQLLPLLDMDLEHAFWSNLMGIIVPWPDVKVGAFSDSIIWSFQHSPYGFGIALQFAGLLMEHALLTAGVLLRGAIAVGPTLHSGAVALGPVMPQAVALEVQTKHPRFGITEAALQHASDEQRAYIQQDRTGHWFDLMSFVRLRHHHWAPTNDRRDEEEVRRANTGPILRDIGAALQRLAPREGDNARVAAKKRWVIRQFNECVERRRAPFHGLAPPLNLHKSTLDTGTSKSSS